MPSQFYLNIARFSKAEIEKLNKSEWWDKEDTWLRENIKKMHDIDLF